MSSDTVIVVGGTSGIGEAIARGFLARGDTVIVVGRDRGRLESALARLGTARGEAGDGGDLAAMRRLFETVGPFDHLVLAQSGGRGAGPLATLELSDLRSGFEAKLFTHLTSLKAALGFVRQSITLISAASARASIPGTAGLAAINGAIEALVRPLAVELAPLRVNAVSPGIVDTPWWDAMPAAAKQHLFDGARATLPVGRVGRPDDVGAATVMVATNGYMTGTVLEVDGGAHLAR